MQCFLPRNTDTRMFSSCENAYLEGLKLIWQTNLNVEVASDIIMEHLTYTFNFTAGLNTVPKVRESDFIIPRQ